MQGLTHCLFKQVSLAEQSSSFLQPETSTGPKKVKRILIILVRFIIATRKSKNLSYLFILKKFLNKIRS